MKRPTKQTALSPKEQHETFLVQVEKLRADGVLIHTDDEALSHMDGLMQKKALTVGSEPSLDITSRNEDN